MGERKHLEVTAVVGIILKWMCRNWNVGSMNWIDIAQDK